MTSLAIARSVMSLFSARGSRSDRARMRVQSFLFAVVFAGGALFASLPDAEHIASEFAVASRHAAVAREPLLREADLPAHTLSATEAAKREASRTDASFIAERNVAAAVKVALRGHASIALARAPFATLARGYNATAPPQS